MKDTERIPNYLLELKNISKFFPGVKALENVDLKIKKGHIHVIVGENGAGKSTLMKIINGLYQPDTGQIFLNGQEQKITSPLEAKKLGISMIHQELNIVPDMTIAENIYLGREITKYKYFIDQKKTLLSAQAYLQQQGLSFHLQDKMKNLSVAQAQIIEIIKAVSCNAKLILMDEPTSALTKNEVEFLFKKIFELKNNGVTIIYISHKMNEIFQIADEISVFRDGRHIETRTATEFDSSALIHLMVGRTLGNIFPPKSGNVGKETLRIENLTQNKVFKDITFHVNAGEIVGMAGLMGAGRTEIVKCIFGLSKADSGSIYLNNRKVEIHCVEDAIRENIAMVTEDRRRYGLILKRNIKENCTLVALRHLFAKFFVPVKKESQETQNMIEKLMIKPPLPHANAEKLSGGNQQKVVLAKWLMLSPKVLILDEPTRGIDIGAKHEIYKLIRQLSQSGVAILMISSELPELIGMADRILVIRNGNLVGTVNGENATQFKIMKLAAEGVS